MITVNGIGGTSFKTTSSSARLPFVQRTRRANSLQNVPDTYVTRDPEIPFDEAN